MDIVDRDVSLQDCMRSGRRLKADDLRGPTNRAEEHRMVPNIRAYVGYNLVAKVEFFAHETEVTLLEKCPVEQNPLLDEVKISIWQVHFHLSATIGEGHRL